MASGGPQFVSAQPDEPWFVWQTEVYLRNFLGLGIEPHEITALFGMPPEATISSELLALQDRFPRVEILAVRDERDERGRNYPPSIQPHLIERWLIDHPDRGGAYTFFHDADIIFRRLPDFAAIRTHHAGACVLSDTSSYIGYDYLHQACQKMRAEQPTLAVDALIIRMADVVGVDVEQIKSGDQSAGGAQYLLQGVGPDYWSKVYRDALDLRELFDTFVAEAQLSQIPDHYIQVWTAGMWSYLWNLWAANHATVVHTELDFQFGVATLDEQSPILHMAGRDETGVPLFTKLDWINDSPIEAVRRQPYLFDGYAPDSASAVYAAAIRAAAGIDNPPALAGTNTPHQYWRLLTWDSGPVTGIWDVAHVHFEFDGDASITEYLSSGDAGAGFGVEHAFDETSQFWGGRPDVDAGHRPELYLGVVLTEPAPLSIATLTNAPGEHHPAQVLIQCSDDGTSWTTTSTVSLRSQERHHVLAYSPHDPQAAAAWRLSTESVSQDFAWDLTQIRFLRAGSEHQGALSASGDAGEGFGVELAATSGSSWWGGRPDTDGRFHLTLRANDQDPQAPDQIAIDRIVLEQGLAHWAKDLTLDRLVDDEWQLWRRFDNLSPGHNDLFLYDSPPDPPGRIIEQPLRPLASNRLSGPRVDLSDPFVDRRIAVMIAAYRDPDVESTVKNALAQAAYPEHLRFVVCHQFDEQTAGVLDRWADDPRFNVDLVPFAESKGCCWARNRTFERYDDEPYVLQIDAHTRFAARWDVRYIEMLESTELDRVILTSYPPSFRVDDGEEVYDLEAGVQRLCIKLVREDLTTLQETEPVPDLSRPGRSPSLAAGQIFTRGRFCREIPYDPDIYFAGEEISLAARAYTSGYELMYPNENLIWHLYDHDEPKHWDDHNGHKAMHKGATQRLRTLFTSGSASFGRYGLGHVRSLASFEEMAGVQFAPVDKGAGETSDPSTKGEAFTPADLLRIDISVIEPRDDYAAFVVVFLDAGGAEVTRTEIRAPDVLDLSRSLVPLFGIDTAGATQYKVLPTTHGGWVGEIAIRDL